jgi:Na+/H+-dicarboxylate symporter
MTTPSLQLSHFTAALIFALFASIVFGITQRAEQRELIRYGAKCFVFFVLGTIAAGWAMWVLRH